MRIGVVSVQVPFVEGGAEVHARNLVRELQARRIEADLITVPFKWYPAQAVLDSIAIARLLDLTESNGQKIDRIVGLKFPAYLVPHPNKVLWILHQHRSAYELWDHPVFGDLIDLPQGRAVRDAVHHADNTFIPEARAVYANSRTVAERLAHNNGIAATPLYHPPGGAELFRAGETGDYFFFPSRFTRIKRQDLVIEALARCREPVRVVFAGAADSPGYVEDLKNRAARLRLGDRVVWQGFTTEAEKVALYADCLGVVYPPVDEDYGYITLEAMLAHKPVITTHDSGGPLEFVVDHETGLVVDADPGALAAAMDQLWRDRVTARKLGEAGNAVYRDKRISWDTVVDVLTA